MKESKLLRKNILEPDAKLLDHRLQLVQGEMVFAALDPVEGGVGDADLLREFGVRKPASFFLQKRCELFFQMPPHIASMAESS